MEWTWKDLAIVVIVAVIASMFILPVFQPAVTNVMKGAGIGSK